MKNVSGKEAEAMAMKYLERVGIANQAQKYPNQLSGGQQQRVVQSLEACVKTLKSCFLMNRPCPRSRNGCRSFGCYDRISSRR